MRVSATTDSRTARLHLSGMQRVAGDMRPVWRQLTAVLRELYRDQYASGAGWVRNDPDTLRQKRGDNPLVGTGLLMRSYISPGARYHYERLTADSMEFGSTDPVANLHKRGSRRLPARDPARVDMAAFRRLSAQAVGTSIISGRASRGPGL